MLSKIKRFFKKLLGRETPISIPTKEARVLELELLLLTTEILRNGNYTNLMNYKNDLNYWANFIVAVCFAESNYNTFETYMETAPLNYLSLGLMQLSYIDQKYYSFCDIQGGKIFEPYNNIHCGIGILDRLVGKKKTPIFNADHYWAVLKPKNKRHKVFLNKFNQLQGAI